MNEINALSAGERVERLKAIYAQMRSAIDADGSFQVYGQHKWRWRSRHEVSGLDIGRPVDQPAAFVAGLRLGLKDCKPGCIEQFLSTVQDPFLRFELLVLAYLTLPAKKSLELIAEESPQRFERVDHRNLLAAAQAHLTCKTGLDLDSFCWSRWNVCPGTRNFLACFADLEFREREPKRYVCEFSSLADQLPALFVPYFDPAKLTRNYKEFFGPDSALVPSVFPDPKVLCLDHEPAEAEPVVLVSCDEKYFTTYAERFLRAYGEAHESPLVHVNTINFELNREELQTLQNATKTRINLTSEVCDGLGPVQATYSAISRFLHLEFMKKHYELLVVLDIDGTVDFQKAELASVPVGKIGLFHPHYTNGDIKTAIWKNVHAGRSVFHSPPDEVLKRLRRFLEITYLEFKAQRERMWHLDQVALSLMEMEFPEYCLHGPKLFQQKKK